MTKDEKIAFTEKYRTQYDATCARLGSNLREWSVDGGFTWHKKQDATTMVRNYDIHPDAHDSIGDILCNVTSPESHAAFIPLAMGLSVDGSGHSVEWHIRNITRERDADRAELKTYKKFHNSWVAQYGQTMKSLHDENMRLHDQLAKFTTTNVAEPQPAKPNPFHDFPNDPRRVGR